MRRIERQERELETKQTSIDEVIISISTLYQFYDLVETRKN